MERQNKPKKSRFLRGITILHEDRDIIVINKPAGLLSMGRRNEKKPNAQAILTNYVRKGSRHSRKPVHIVHRLDRETSGILIFALSRQGQEILKKNWNTVKKTYQAVVHGHFDSKFGKITSYLTENEDQFVHSTDDHSIGKLSHTAYSVKKTSRRYSLLEINLLTGRKNQIRVHMAEAGHPVVGDRKYGQSRSKKKQRMALHAKSIAFNHPFNNQRLFFETKTPDIFEVLMTGTPEKSSSSPDRKTHAEKKKSSKAQKTLRRTRK